MHLKSLSLQNFRNYEAQCFTFDNHNNLIIGENAQGKTNLLEAIAFLSTMKLFRTGQKKEGLRFEQESGKIEAVFDANNRDNTLKIHIHRNKSIEIFYNGVRMRRQSEVIGILQSVLFSPDDLYLVRDGSAARRRFLDTALCQLRPNYARILEEYNRVLDHKTRILRDSEEKPSLLDLLDDFTLRLGQLGAQLVRRRAHFIKALALEAGEIHGNIAGNHEKLDIAYKTVSSVTDPFAPVQAVAEELLQHAEAHRAAEISARSCLSGPHKDDLVLSINGARAAAFASQGQVRTCALALKLAERELFFKDSGEYPLLLLDDVLSELDSRRQQYVLGRISQGQVFITCCEPNIGQKLENGKILNIKSGKLV